MDVKNTEISRAYKQTIREQSIRANFAVPALQSLFMGGAVGIVIGVLAWAIVYGSTGQTKYALGMGLFFFLLTCLAVAAWCFWGLVNGITPVESIERVIGADLNGNGQVGPSEPHIVHTNWGPSEQERFYRKWAGLLWMVYTTKGGAYGQMQGRQLPGTNIEVTRKMWEDMRVHLFKSNIARKMEDGRAEILVPYEEALALMRIPKEYWVGQ